MNDGPQLGIAAILQPSAVEQRTRLRAFEPRAVTIRAIGGVVLRGALRALRNACAQQERCACGHRNARSHGFGSGERSASMRRANSPFPVISDLVSSSGTHAAETRSS